jgi:phage FluMu protein Com
LTIEFSCQHCGKALSTSDEKAGRKAKCPQCGEVIQVPALEGAAAGTEAEDEDELEPAPPGERKMENCPMCGESVPASAKKCEFCGEELFADAPRGRRGHQTIEAGEVISAGWKIFKAEMGMTIGGVIVAGLLNGAVQMPGMILGFIGGMAQSQGDMDTFQMMTILQYALMPFVYLASWYIQLGQSRLLLNIARGETAQIGDLFSGGKYFWRMAGASFLFTIMVSVGFVACIVPGILLSLMFWPYAFVLIDDDPPGIECLMRSRDVTKDNLGSVFVLGLATIGINLLGLLAMCVGVIFTGPLTALLFAVAYCKMTGQRTAE